MPTPPSSLQIAFGESGFLSYVPADGGPINCSNYGNLTVNITAFTAYIVTPPVGEQTITCSNYTTRLIVSGKWWIGGGGGGGGGLGGEIMTQRCRVVDLGYQKWNGAVNGGIMVLAYKH